MNKKFSPFDPLEAKQGTVATDVAINAVKREIRNILDSYVGWFDPFCELIQNSLDAVEERTREIDDNSYEPKIFISIDLQQNELIVTDNGIGLDEPKFRQFLAPSFSFKSKKNGTRGHKGVGATYVAYGFNYMQISTKTPSFASIGRIENARRWLSDDNPSGNPLISFDEGSSKDERFRDLDRGVSIAIKFDKYTHPNKLSWIGAETADVWYKILCAKTGLGAFIPNENIKYFLGLLIRKE